MFIKIVTFLWYFTVYMCGMSKKCLTLLRKSMTFIEWRSKWWGLFLISGEAKVHFDML